MTQLLLDIHFELGGGVFNVVECTLDETISEGIRATVEVVAEEPFALDGAPLQNAVLRLEIGGDVVRTWTLRVQEARFAGTGEGGFAHHRRYRFELHDTLLPLGLVADTRKFRDVTTQTIVDTVLGKHGVKTQWQTTDALAPRPWCVQYQERSRDFVLRLLEAEGVHFGFAPDGTVVFSDDSRSAPRIMGRSTLSLSEDPTTVDPREGTLLSVRRGTRVGTGAVSLGDFNWKKPGLSLLTKATGSRDGELETYDYPGGYRDPSTGSALAQKRLEARQVETEYLTGRCSSMNLQPGRTFGIDEARLADLSGDYFLTRVVHHARLAPEDGGDVSPIHGAGRSQWVYFSDFEAIPSAMPFRPALRRRRPVVAGFHTAMVRGPEGSEIHTDSHGRFKAQFHWDREATGTDKDSRWLRMTQETASGMTLARLGWEVSVGYIDGDPDRPIGLARNINGEMIPSYGQPANKTMMTIKTPSSPATGGFNELKLEDKAGAMRFDLRAERDLVGQVRNDREERVGRDELHVVGESLTRAVSRDQTIHVGGNQTDVINGDMALEVTGNRTKAIGAREKIEVGAARSETTEGSDTEKVKTARMTIAGGVGAPPAAEVKSKLIPSPKSAAASVAMGALRGGAKGGGVAGAIAGGKGAAGSLVKTPNLSSIASMFLEGSISRTAETSILRMVGGAWITVAVGNIATEVGYAYAETVGGAKLTVAKNSISEKAGLGLATTVGGAVLRTASDAMTFSSKLAKTTVGGLLQFNSEESVSIKATTITLTSLAGLSFHAGALGIVMTPDSMKVVGDWKLVGGPQIKVKSATENLTGT